MALNPVVRDFVVGTLTDWRTILMVGILIVLGLWAISWGDCYRQAQKRAITRK